MAMKFDPPLSPKGLPPRGTIEKLMGAALLQEANDGTYEWEGGTDIWWDEQKSIRNEQNQVCLIDDEGNEWWATMTETYDDTNETQNDRPEGAEADRAASGEDTETSG